eukprot:SM000054S18042  [mRNA]  locus=s54:77267:78120:- [translate_table: standard]
MSTTFLEGRSTDGTSPSTSGALPAYNFEYRTETCRGAVEELNGGALECTRVTDGVPIPSIQRHHLCSAVLQGGMRDVCDDGVRYQRTMARG